MLKVICCDSTVAYEIFCKNVQKKFTVIFRILVYLLWNF